jgi:hypothetical protein
MTFVYVVGYLYTKQLLYMLFCIDMNLSLSLMEEMDNSTVKMVAICSPQDIGTHQPQDHNMNRLRVYESRVLKRIFGSEGAEVTRGWRNCIIGTPCHISLR